jgi:hypothetical protein
MAHKHKEDAEEAKVLQGCEKIQLPRNGKSSAQQFTSEIIMLTTRNMQTLIQKRT